MDDKKTAWGEQAGRDERETRAGRRRGQSLARLRHRMAGRVSGVARGVLLAGAAYLVGTAPLALGAAPLGLALLAASAGYTWYILAGLLVAALTHPVTLPALAWVGVYTLCLLLRLAVLFFVDPPALPGEERAPGVRGALGYARRYLWLCLRSVGDNLGLGEDRARRRSRDIDTDYYAGSPWERAGRRSADQSAGADAAEREQELPHPMPPRIGLFSEHPFLRALSGAVAGFAAGTVGLFEGGFHLYDLLGALLMVFVTPAVALLLTPCFESAGETLLFAPHPLRDAAGSSDDPGVGIRHLRARFRIPSLVAVAALLLGVCFSTRRATFLLGTPYLTVEVGLLLGMLFTLSAGSRLGLLPGLAVALISGLGGAVERLPILLLTAVVYAFLRILSHRTAVIGGVLAGVLWCVGYGGMTALLLHLPTLCLSAPIFLLCERLWERMPLSAAEEEQAESDFTLAVTGELRLTAGRERMDAISRALLDMSGRLSDMARAQYRLGREEQETLCRTGTARVCQTCERQGDCPEADRLCRSLLAQLGAKGRVDMEDLPEALRDGCVRVEETVAEIDRRLAELAEAQARGGKTEVMAADYAHMASLLADAAAEGADETLCNWEAADRVYDYLAGLGVSVQGVVVCGRRSRRVIVRGDRMDRLEAQPEEVAERLGALCEAKLAPPRFERRESYTVMTLCALPSLKPVYAGSTVPVGCGEILPPPLTDREPWAYVPPPVCGDHIAVFRNEQACFYALISDGMGSGEAASAASEICAAFLERMLSAGSRLEISMQMLNSFLCARGNGSGDECSATVDLMELDTACGHAVFAKSSAAPTYVIRGGTVYKLRSRSLPLGILRDSEPQLLRFRMHPGDVVVMVSDGVTQGNDECSWLIDLLSDPLPDSMDDLRLDILRHAMASGSPDDLSAIAIRVEEP